jgi:hypothetical protein
MVAIRVVVESPESTLEGTVDICQDLDGRFVVIDDDGESFYVNAWQCEISFPEFDGFTLAQVLSGLTTPVCE